MPTDPFGPRKATAKPDLKAARKAVCAGCATHKTVYPTRVFPVDRPWEQTMLCSDCLKRLQDVQLWPLPPAQG